MKPLYTVLLIAVVMIWSCDGKRKETTGETGQPKTDAPATTTSPLSGTDKISLWKQASDAQKSALSEQIVATANQEPGAKILAKDMTDCLDEAIRSLDKASDVTLTEVATPCVVMLRQMSVTKK